MTAGSIGGELRRVGLVAAAALVVVVGFVTWTLPETLARSASPQTGPVVAAAPTDGTALRQVGEVAAQGAAGGDTLGQPAPHAHVESELDIAFEKGNFAMHFIVSG